MRWVAIAFIALIVVVAPPRTFPIGQKVEIVGGGSVAATLKEEHVISSTFLFTTLARLTSVDTKLKSGRYVFASSLPMPAVLWKIVKGDHGTHVRKITIPEGYTNAQIDKLVGLEIGEGDQGYLFPDTYFFDQFSTADEIQARMLTNFETRVGTISTQTVILASIVEAEAASTTDRRLVAGILLKRLAARMPLQVDAATSTYEHLGLPARPINNPGLDAISAATHPTNSPYWYYLSDKSGTMHYARTFVEHKRNRERFGI